MAIPEMQLDTWAHQGSVTQSANTYNAVKGVLGATETPFAARNIDVFLQGSYGNDTNIYSESDVDIVILCHDTYFDDLSELTPPDRAAYDKAFIAATYPYQQFKTEVVKVLTDAYGSGVKVGDRAIAIAAGGSRRKADVIAAMEFRRYFKFRSHFDSSYVEGICFFDSSGTRIANYPKQHSANLARKHQSSNKRLKPMVRVLKNMRCKLVDDGMLDAGVAPSYFLEGLLYNVPDSKYGVSYGSSLVDALNWIQEEADKKALLTANEQYFLLWDGVPTCWPHAGFNKYMEEVVRLWNDW